MIQIINENKIELNRNEIYRYLGYKNSKPDDNIKKLIDHVIIEAYELISYKACYNKFPIKINDNKIDLGFTTVKSENLLKNLKDCDEIILFGATIGAEFDRLLNKYSKLSPSSAVVLNAIGTASIEAWCNILSNIFKATEEKNNRFLRPRFSPGYGDLSIEIQKDIFNVLNCNKNIGLSLTDSLIMTPSKSVTAIIGISKIDLKCSTKGCEECKKINCEFRRN